MPDLITLTEKGLYCAAGDFYIDPWRPVGKALITHAHSDHARPGSGAYLTATPGKSLLNARLEERARIETVAYGVLVTINGVSVSFHPAGHVLGSAQVRIELNGEVWVVSGDYKRASDPTCEPFEPVSCHTFITESTFGLPIYKWPTSEEVMDQINEWWLANSEAGKTSLLFGYALGKAQRILAGLRGAIGPIYTHGAVERLTQVYRGSGVKLPPTEYVGNAPRGTKFAGSLVIAPPSAQATPWTRRFGATSTAFASGWMRIRGTRRRKSVDRGFVLSDHADWEGLLSAIKDSGAERVIVTHGYTAEMVRWLNESGLQASSFSTEYEGESQELQPPEESTEESGDESPPPQAAGRESVHSDQNDGSELRAVENFNEESEP